MFNKTILVSSSENMNFLTAHMRNFLKVACFTYLKIYSDGTHINLSTRVDWQLCFYEKLHQHGAYHKTMDTYDTGFHLSSQLVDQVIPNILREDFGIGDGITFVEKHKDCCEFFAFGADSKYQGVTAWYINNLDVLKRFCLFFKERGQKLIKDAEADRLILPKCLIAKPEEIIVGASFIAPEAQKIFLDSISVERYPLCDSSQTIYITKKELISIKHMSVGNTIKQTAKLMGISPRTVETHVNNLKFKLRAKNVVEAIVILARKQLI